MTTQAPAPLTCQTDYPAAARAGPGLSMWVSSRVGCARSQAGFAAFFASLFDLRSVPDERAGLLSVLPPGAIAGVTILALACILGARRLCPGRTRWGSVPRLAGGGTICLDGVTAPIQPEPTVPDHIPDRGLR